MTSPLLASIPLFADLTDEQRGELAKSLQQRHVTADQPLFWIGDDGSEFYLISHGHIRLSCPDDSGQEMALAELGPGQFFGELALLDGGRRTATARAVGEATLLSLDRASFQQFLLANPSATLRMIAVLGRRQREMVEKLRGVPNANEVYKDQTTTWNRVADVIATISASRGFVLAHAIGVIVWVGLNIALGDRAWDPYPFMFLTLWASMEAIFLSMFVLISQNRQGEKDRIRNDLDYQVNRKAHLEVMQLHEKMDRMEAMLEAMHSTDGDGAVTRR
jgi:CRP/FNR family cyclic AMP-dependent transcriptional regulator